MSIKQIPIRYEETIIIVNVSRIVRYREPVKGQRVEKLKIVEVDRVKKWEVKKILNKKKVRGIIKYLVQ